MPKFLVKATYTAEGHKGLAKDSASSRKAVLASAAKKLGGKLEAFYFTLGEDDAILILDMPDHIAMAAVATAACASGAVRTHTDLLLTAAEMDEALAKPVNYRAPGA